MRDFKRIPKILKRIEKVWIRYPDMRLCQLLDCIRVMYQIPDLFYVEDERLVEKLEEHFKEKDKK